jgi:hypothetical protein
MQSINYIVKDNEYSSLSQIPIDTKSLYIYENINRINKQSKIRICSYICSNTDEKKINYNNDGIRIYMESFDVKMLDNIFIDIYNILNLNLINN